MSKYPLRQGDYLKHRGVACPNCGGNHVEGEHVEVSFGGATQECSCPDCGATWIDEYKLIGYDNLVIPKEK